MQTIAVSTSQGAYEVRIGPGLLPSIGRAAREAAGGARAFVVTDENVAAHYLAGAVASLEAAGYAVSSRVLPAGEATKTMASLTALLEDLAAAGMARDDCVVALGGGVIGDLAGFAAAVYMRGCPYIQVPTSLLAMVDSSVGGKTAVDLAAGKNLAGAFWQPRAVIADVTTLETVSDELFRDSVGEVIKYGVLGDAGLFAELERAPLVKADLDMRRAEDVVSRCVAMKRDVVEADEREGGIRQTLNLGHTVGHAIESASGFALGHGSCVAAGLAIMARACVRRGLCPAADAARIEAVIAAHGLPVTSDVGTGILFDLARSDKKRHGERMNVVLVRGIGAVEVRSVPLAELKGLIEEGR
ncbi:MAG: 3-dehydroquinate synthase [Coriobacteriaceae bacterium]|nr:3-dehydroquinate synthase [Coriobacteriaceae bacterium]